MMLALRKCDIGTNHYETAYHVMLIHSSCVFWRHNSHLISLMHNIGLLLISNSSLTSTATPLVSVFIYIVWRYHIPIIIGYPHTHKSKKYALMKVDIHVHCLGTSRIWMCDYYYSSNCKYLVTITESYATH